MRRRSCATRLPARSMAAGNCRSSPALRAASICDASERAPSSAAAARPAAPGPAAAGRGASPGWPSAASPVPRRESEGSTSGPSPSKPETLVLGGDGRRRVGDFLLQAGHLALQRGDPGHLLLHGLDARGLPAQGLAGPPSADASLRSSCRWLRSCVQLPLALLHAAVEGVEPPDGVLGHGRLRPQGGQFVVHGRPPPPSLRAVRWPARPPATR